MICCRETCSEGHLVKVTSESLLSRGATFGSAVCGVSGVAWMMWDGVCGLEPPLEAELLWEAVPPPVEGVSGSFLGVMGADLVGVRSLETAAVMSATFGLISGYGNGIRKIEATFEIGGIISDHGSGESVFKAEVPDKANAWTRTLQVKWWSGG